MNWYTTIHQKNQVPKMEALIYICFCPHPQNSLMRYSTFTLGLWNFWESPGLQYVENDYILLYSHVFYMHLYTPSCRNTWINSGVFGGFHSLGAQTGIAQGASRCWCFRLPGLVAKLTERLAEEVHLEKKVAKSGVFVPSHAIDHLWSFWGLHSV